MKNSYESRRNVYRKNRGREQRSLMAVVAVSIMAAAIMAGYGIISLFSDEGEGKPVIASVVSTGSSVTQAKDTAGGSTDTTASASTASEAVGGTVIKETASTASATVSVASTVSVAGTTKSKKDISELVTVEKKAAEKYYEGAAFLGDSRTQGLQINAGIKSPDFFAGRGLNIKNARTEKVVKNAAGKSVTVIDALKDKSYRKIYIGYGINELGWPYTSTFTDEYKKTIEAIQKIQPDAEIVVCSILPVTEKKSKSDKIFNMKNVKKFNKAIKSMAKEIGVKYVNLSPAVADSKGFLPADVTPDGVHMDREYCRRVLAYIVNMEY